LVEKESLNNSIPCSTKMINYKTSKLLYLISENCRITSKELSKSLKISQQSASYTVLNLLKKKRILNYQTLIDPAKFGLINIIAFFRYTNFDNTIINQIKKYLKETQFVTSIENVTQGSDLMIEYCVPNLSLFNKENRDFLHKFTKNITMNDIYVVIVKHIYNRKYLMHNSPQTEIVLSGDRDLANLSMHQLQVLEALKNNPKESIIQISKKVKLDPKTVIKIKKYLEKQMIIRKYSSIINYSSLEINRKHALIQLDYEKPNDIKKFIEYAKNHKNIISVIKTLGDYEILITIERTDSEKSVMTELRKEFKISDYKLIPSEGILKKKYVPDIIFK